MSFRTQRGDNAPEVEFDTYLAGADNHAMHPSREVGRFDS